MLGAAQPEVELVAHAWHGIAMAVSAQSGLQTALWGLGACDVINLFAGASDTADNFVMPVPYKLLLCQHR